MKCPTFHFESTLIIAPVQATKMKWSKITKWLKYSIGGDQIFLNIRGEKWYAYK